MKVSAYLNVIVLTMMLTPKIFAGDSALPEQGTTGSPRPFGLIIHGGAGSLKNKDPEIIRQKLEEILQAGYAMLEDGSNAMEVVVEVVSRMEDSGSFNCGQGAVPNREGHYELDASIMSGVGGTNSAGAVIGVSHVKNPIRVARDLAQKSGTVVLAGKGAEEFARPLYPPVSEDYFDTPKKRKDLEEFLKAEQARNEKAESSSSPSAALDPETQMGTVGCCVLDRAGNLAAGTSTGGLIGKRPGRVGDSPLIGSGTWAQNATCAVSCTGVGEYFIRANAAGDVSAQMEYAAKAVQQAVTDTLKKIGQFPGALGGLIAIDASGNIAFDFNTSQMPRAWHVSGSNAVVVIR